MTYPLPAGQAYFVAARYNGRTVALCGPFGSHGEAAKLVDPARIRLSRERPNDLGVQWADYGVALAEAEQVRPVFGVAA